MCDQKFGFDGVWVVKIDLGMQGTWKTAHILVIRIMLKVGDSVRANSIQNFPDDSGFARTRTPGNSDHKRCGLRHAGDYSLKKVRSGYFYPLRLSLMKDKTTWC